MLLMQSWQSINMLLLTLNKGLNMTERRVAKRLLSFFRAISLIKTGCLLGKYVVGLKKVTQIVKGSRFFKEYIRKS